MSERAQSRLHMEAMREDAPVSPLELFFDLVFVFALTQVTAFMADSPSAHGVLRGVLIIGLLWWSWVGYAWLCNVVRADAGGIRAVLVIAMAAMFVLALSIPEAFEDLPGGLSGPVVIALCYFAFRLMHLVMFWIISRDDPGLRRQLIKFTPSVIGGTVLLLIASQFTGETQTALWALALLADYGGTFIGGARGWRLRSASHFAERHGLILIVALGESIVAIGVGVAGQPISLPIIGASVLGLVLAATMWWAYFDTSSLVGEHALADEPEATRAGLARDAYSFLHLPLLVGVVLCALGLKKVLEYVGDASHHHISDPLKGVGLYALYLGIVVYLVGHVAFKWRVAGKINVDRLIAAAVVAALIPVAARVPALVALLIATLVVVAVMAVEAVRHADHRRSIHQEHGRRHGHG
ncbi:low temperature requirement protein A [Herbihabitans rhizosphaerae]|nr:low temperature requirement protein A [Herbihabitans rhizosphaerae]